MLHRLCRRTGSRDLSSSLVNPRIWLVRTKGRPSANGPKQNVKPKGRMLNRPMLSFVQFLEELSKGHITLSPAEVQSMRDRFGDKTLQMGHLDEDGTMSIPVDSIVEAVQSLGSRKLNEA